MSDNGPKFRFRFRPRPSRPNGFQKYLLSQNVEAQFPSKWLKKNLISSSSSKFFFLLGYLLLRRSLSSLSVMLMATNLSFSPQSLIPLQKPSLLQRVQLGHFLHLNSVSQISTARLHSGSQSRVLVRAALDSDYSSKRSSSNEQRETIMLPGCDYNHWLIVMEFPKDPAPTREQMIDTYLNTLATVLGRFSLSHTISLIRICFFHFKYLYETWNFHFTNGFKNLCPCNCFSRLKKEA